MGLMRVSEAGEEDEGDKEDDKGMESQSMATGKVEIAAIPSSSLIRCSDATGFMTFATLFVGNGNGKHRVLFPCVVVILLNSAAVACYLSNLS